MAGRPRERLMVIELELRTREHFEDNEHSVLDFVCSWQEQGRTLNSLARQIAAKLDIALDPENITRWLYRAFDRETVVRRLAEAREAGAYALVDQALDDAEQIKHKDQAPVVRVRNDARFWTAQRFNRRELGDPKPGVSVTLNVASLHLDAMRQRSTERVSEVEPGARARSVVCHHDTHADQPAIAGAIVEDAQIISIDDSTT